ncbi:MAG: hypothetical protein JKY37_04840 [Nannocystaceae bacterium]|nr:hypothetical protein [Nannocystaceae bacterium]
MRTPADAGFKRQSDGRLVFRDPEPTAQWTAELLADGRIRFTDHYRTRRIPTLNDLSHVGDLIRKKQGMKLWIKRKQRLLAATRDMRLGMAVAFAEKNIDGQLSQLYRDLLEIWRGDEPPWTRRALIFATWDDCEEGLAVDLGEFTDSEASKIDTIRHDAGQRARTKIVAFIRRHIPKGSTDAFTAAELASFNRGRQSKARFTPYTL